VESFARARDLFSTYNDAHLAGQVESYVADIIADAPADRRDALKQQWLDAGHPSVWDVG
jgi:hypothetical protein